MKRLLDKVLAGFGRRVLDVSVLPDPTVLWPVKSTTLIYPSASRTVRWPKKDAP